MVRMTLPNSIEDVILNPGEPHCPLDRWQFQNLIERRLVDGFEANAVTVVVPIIDSEDVAYHCRPNASDAILTSDSLHDCGRCLIVPLQLLPAPFADLLVVNEADGHLLIHHNEAVFFLACPRGARVMAKTALVVS